MEDIRLLSNNFCSNLILFCSSSAIYLSIIRIINLIHYFFIYFLDDNTSGASPKSIDNHLGPSSYK